MSVSIATMGLFKECCGGGITAGGAPPYRQNAEEVVRPRVVVSSVEMKSKKSIGEMMSSIKVKLVDIGD